MSSKIKNFLLDINDEQHKVRTILAVFNCLAIILLSKWDIDLMIGAVILNMIGVVFVFFGVKYYKKKWRL